MNYRITAATLAALMVTACGDVATSSDGKQAAQQEAVAVEANSQVGFPGVTNFKKVATFSYVVDMNGRLFHVCDSIGYGLPYGVQFTNPEKVVNESAGQYYYHGTMPQPEPNGLFMPPGAEGTWIMCATPKGGIDPVYVEPRVIVSPHKLHSSGDWQE